ncbi:MAG TPA: hypothetical protein VEI45_19850 [Mycobacterium sp.]|uniref:hypothetical protein n=1 Tax=Mycobacterium sp. TaxID=1785 RepID=UPI002D591613|nr:hypothetical protein [Mycobacterium sp.]HXY66549.1 hypothetical protein [Mycobacterium sp.]
MRTETVICDTRDLGLGWRVTAENWKALRAVGEKANQNGLGGCSEQKALRL